MAATDFFIDLNSARLRNEIYDNPGYFLNGRVPDNQEISILSSLNTPLDGSLELDTVGSIADIAIQKQNGPSLISYSTVFEVGNNTPIYNHTSLIMRYTSLLPWHTNDDTLDIIGYDAYAGNINNINNSSRRIFTVFFINAKLENKTNYGDLITSSSELKLTGDQIGITTDGSSELGIIMLNEALEVINPLEYVTDKSKVQFFIDGEVNKQIKGEYLEDLINRTSNTASNSSTSTNLSSDSIENLIRTVPTFEDMVTLTNGFLTENINVPYHVSYEASELDQISYSSEEQLRRLALEYETPNTDRSKVEVFPNRNEVDVTQENIDFVTETEQANGLAPGGKYIRQKVSWGIRFIYRTVGNLENAKPTPVNANVRIKRNIFDYNENKTYVHQNGSQQGQVDLSAKRGTPLSILASDTNTFRVTSIGKNVFAGNFIRTEYVLDGVTRIALFSHILDTYPEYLTPLVKAGTPVELQLEQPFCFIGNTGTMGSFPPNPHIHLTWVAGFSIQTFTIGAKEYVRIPEWMKKSIGIEQDSLVYKW